MILLDVIIIKVKIITDYFGEEELTKQLDLNINIQVGGGSYFLTKSDMIFKNV